MIDLYSEDNLIVEYDSTDSVMCILSNEKLTYLNVADLAADPDYQMYYPTPKNWIIV